MNEIDQTIAQGDSAQKLLENPAYIAAVEQTKQRAMEEFAASKPGDSGAREAAFFKLKAIEELDQRLRTMLFNGQFEQERIKRRGRPPKV